MKTRCPFIDCNFCFEVADALSFKIATCQGCGREITIRSLERHVAVDRVVTTHRESATLFEMEEFSRAETVPRIVGVLEDIRSLWNVGSMFRTADGAGCEELILTGITGYPPRKEIEKTSLGAESVIRWSYAANSMSVLPALKSLGYCVLALEKDERSTLMSSVIDARQLRFPLCVVVGNEVTGLYRETLNIADHVCHLPMRGIKSSLNVAVAFGIAMYQIADCCS